MGIKKKHVAIYSLIVPTGVSDSIHHSKWSGVPFNISTWISLIRVHVATQLKVAPDAISAYYLINF